MPEILFVLASFLFDNGFQLLGASLHEILVTMSGGDWGCGAVSELLFRGNDVAACEWLNSLPDMTEPA